MYDLEGKLRQARHSHVSGGGSTNANLYCAMNTVKKYEIEKINGFEIRVDGHSLEFSEDYSISSHNGYDILWDGKPCFKAEMRERSDPVGYCKPFIIGDVLYFRRFKIVTGRRMPEGGYYSINLKTGEKFVNEYVVDIINANDKPLFTSSGRVRGTEYLCLEYDGIKFPKFRSLSDIYGNSSRYGPDPQYFLDGHICFIGSSVYDNKPLSQEVFVYDDKSKPEGYSQIGPYDKIIVDVPESTDTSKNSTNGLERIKDLQSKFSDVDFSRYQSITNFRQKVPKEFSGFIEDDLGQYGFLGMTKDGKYEVVYQDKYVNKGYEIIGPYDKIIFEWLNYNTPHIIGYNEKFRKPLSDIFGRNNTNSVIVGGYKKVYSKYYGYSSITFDD